MSTVSLDSTITLAISVRDRHASADWYKKHLGFELLFHADEAGWSEVRTKTEGVTLGLGANRACAWKCHSCVWCFQYRRCPKSAGRCRCQV